MLSIMDGFPWKISSINQPMVDPDGSHESHPPDTTVNTPMADGPKKSDFIISSPSKEWFPRGCLVGERIITRYKQ